MRRIIAFLAALMLLGTVPMALAEEVPMQEQAAVSISLGSKTNVYTLYSGPGEDYFIAKGAKDSVSHQHGQVFCYGYTADGWLMVMQKDADGLRHTGWVYAPEAIEKAAEKSPLLSFGEKQVTLKSGTFLREGTGDAQVTATVSGEATLLMYFPDDAVYIEAAVDGSGQKARGFIRLGDIAYDAALNLPMRPDADEYLRLMSEIVLSLPEDAIGIGMNVYPLSDGTYLVAYHCAGSDRLWMRVISAAGKKIFAKSVPELYLSQITLTETGFICETFEDSEICSGTRYTYTCKGNQWKSARIKYVDDPDRYYSCNTEHFTLRRYPFGEGSVIPMEIECRTTGAAICHQMTYGSGVFLCEYKDKTEKLHLLVHAEDENGRLSVRAYDDSARLVNSAASPMPETVDGAVACQDAVYFYAGSGDSRQRWRLELSSFTFDAEPLNIAVPAYCTLNPIAPTASDQLVLMQSEFASYLCDVTAQGTLLKVQELPGIAVWTGECDGGFLLLMQNPNGDFVLQRYAVNLE